MIMKDTFVKEILRDVQDNFNYSNTDYEIVGWEQKSVTKNNDVIKQGFIAKIIDTNTSRMLQVMPNIYVEEYFNDYKKGTSREEIVKSITSTLEKSIASSPEKTNNIEEIFGAGYIMENVSLRLINTKANAEMLNSVPHVDFMDLSYVFRVNLANYEEGAASYLLNNELYEQKLSGIDTDVLFEKAKENMLETNPPEICTMFDKLVGSMGLSEEEKEMLQDMQDDADKRMFVFSNKNGVNGASVLAYEDVLHDFCVSQDANVYIIPSSIHECLLVTASGYIQPNEIGNMVQEVNMTVVSTDETLSNNVYFYDRDSREFSIANKGPELIKENKMDMSRGSGKIL